MRPTMRGLLGRKIGMTRVYDKNGAQVAVTVLEVGPCVVLQRKTVENDGYEAAQIGFADVKESRATKARVGHCAKAGTAPKRHVAEFELDKGEEAKAGDTLTAAMFDGVEFVDVTGVTKGRGFQGVMKRHNMRGGPMGHSGRNKRRPGSSSSKEKPARVIKGKRGPGHMGDVTVTAQNLRIERVIPDANLVLVRGAVMGAIGGLVHVNRALKRTAVTTK